MASLGSVPGSRQVCRAPEYRNAAKTAGIVKHLCSQENYAQKCQLTEFVSATNLMNCPKGSREDDYYINEEGMYELLFPSQLPEAKNFRKHCCNVMFLHVRQQLNKPLQTKTTGTSLSSMRTWNCRHNETFVRPGYNDVKTPSPILEHVT